MFCFVVNRPAPFVQRSCMCRQERSNELVDTFGTYSILCTNIVEKEEEEDKEEKENGKRIDESKWFLFSRWFFSFLMYWQKNIITKKSMKREFSMEWNQRSYTNCVVHALFHRNYSTCPCFLLPTRRMGSKKWMKRDRGRNSRQATTIKRYLYSVSMASRKKWSIHTCLSFNRSSVVLAVSVHIAVGGGGGNGSHSSCCCK